jgi:hypothetical protein
MVSIELVPNPNHPEGGHAILQVTLSGRAHVGDCDIRIKQKADELWLHPHGWGEGSGEPLRIHATDVSAAGNELHLKLGPDIVRHLTVGFAYLVECTSHDFNGPFRVRENIKIAPEDEGYGREVRDQRVPTGTPKPKTGSVAQQTESELEKDGTANPPDPPPSEDTREPPPVRSPDGNGRLPWFVIPGGIAALVIVTAALAYILVFRGPSTGVYDPKFKKAFDDYEKLRVQINK